MSWRTNPSPHTVPESGQQSGDGCAVSRGNLKDLRDGVRSALPLRKVEVSLRPVATAGTARRRVGRDDGSVALRALGSGEGVRGLHPRGNVAFAVQYAPDIDVVRAFDVKDQVGVA